MKRRLALILLLSLAVGGADSLRAQETNWTGLDKNALQAIVRKNIFDPTRTGGRSGRRARRVESFTYCGSSAEGQLTAAFFTGAGAPRKPLLPGDNINGFKIDAVTFNSVTLKPADGPLVTLNMDTSMRREENGPWKPSERAAEAETANPAVSTDAAPAAASSVNDSDVIKRLKARREDN